MPAVTAIATEQAVKASKSFSLLRLMQLSSAALPVGGYSYSHGLETAVDLAWINGPQDTYEWLVIQLTHGVASLDVAIIFRLYKAFNRGNVDDILYWNDYLLASRETQELLLADVEMAKALLRLLNSLEVDLSRFDLNQSFNKTDLSSHRSFCTLFAAAAWQWQVTDEDCAYGYCWSWLENQVAAATKLVPLGQTQAQQLLGGLQATIVSAVATAKTLPDEAIGSSLPGVAIASAKHEYQYSRLFRS